MKKETNSKNKATNVEVSPPITDIVKNIEGLPDEKKRELIAQITMKRTTVSGQGNSDLMFLMPLMDKFNEEHITKVLENQSVESKNKHTINEKEINHKFYIIVIAIVTGVALLGLLIFSLKLFEGNTNASQIISDIFKYLIGAVFGFLGGYGVRHVSKK